MPKPDVVIVGAGLAGLSCALELSDAGVGVAVVEARAVVGGRTSSWIEQGMPVESGLHRVLGFYQHFPRLLRRAGIDVNDIVVWEDEVEIRLPDNRGNVVLGAAPLYRPAATAVGALGLLNILSAWDLASLGPFFTAGLFQYLTAPSALDQWNVADYARASGVTDDAIRRLLVPLTSGLFFLPPDEYSAYAFFGVLGPYLPQIYTVRVGAFRGGMTEVMAAPLAAAVRRRGGQVHTGRPVRQLLFDGTRVVGVDIGGERIMANHVVVATPLEPAQRLIRRAVAGHPWFQPMLRLPSMSSVTVQMELDAPSMRVDHTTFGPDTALASFAEQSRTTFRGLPGRLSIILTPPAHFVRMSDPDILAIVTDHAHRLGLRVRGHVIRSRVIRMPADFYRLGPGCDALRPPQATPVPGLTLAGDYTRQKYLATMEGAVVSGHLAAKAVRSALESHTRS